MVECNWQVSYTLTVPADWVSGVYVAKLTTGSSGVGRQSYIIFVVRDDTRPSDYLFQSSVTTYQAYNFWGGQSLYSWGNDEGKQARKVSFNRPYIGSPNPNAAYGVGAGEFLTNIQPVPLYPISSAGWEYNMVRWLEKEGCDVSYSTNVDTHARGDLLPRHRAFLSVGHDEYWSFEMRANVEAARDQGVSLGFFSSNTCYWQIRFEPGSPQTGNAPDRTIVCYKSSQEDPHQRPERKTTLWRLLSRPEEALIGVMYDQDPVDADIVIKDASHWVCANTGLQNGSILPGLLGYEADRMFGNAPPTTQPIAHSPYTPLRDGFPSHSDMIAYTASSGATVFATGSMQWSWGLDDYNVSQGLRTSRLNTAAQQMTHNVLQRFTATQPTPTPTPVASFSDDFNDNVRDATKWTVGALNEGASTFDPQIAVLEQNGQLEITPRVNLNDLRYGGYISAATWNMTDARATVKVVQTTADNADTTFAVAIDADNWYRFVVEGGQLYFQDKVDGIKLADSVPYNASQHRFWRLRHDPAADSIVFETGDEQSAWSIRRTITRRLPLTAMRVELDAGTYSPVNAPGTAVFDDFRLEPSNPVPSPTPTPSPTPAPTPTPQPAMFSDNFDDNARDAIKWSFDVINEGANSFDPDVPVLEQNQRLEITPLPNIAGLHYNGYVSVATWDVTGAQASVEVVQTTNNAGFADTTFALSGDSNNWYRFTAEHGILYMQERVNERKTFLRQIPYDVVQHRWWRLRHDLSNDTIIWETSPDGTPTTWTEQHAQVRQIAITALRVELQAGTWQVENAPGVSIFDNFRLGR